MKRWIEGIRPSRSEEGAVLLTVALTSLVIFGLVAIGVDGSRMYNERRHVQNASDEAALAGAWAWCQGAGGVTPAARASAAANGFDNSGTDNSVSVTHPYDGDPSLVRVHITSTQDASFGAVIGFDDLTVAADSVARCDKDAGGIGVAIFAAGEVCGSNNLDAQSSSIYIEGGLHTNDGLHVNNATANATIIGPATYVGSATGNGIPPQAAQSGYQDYPVIWDIEDYAPGGAIAQQVQTADPTTYHHFPGDLNNANAGPGVSAGSGGTMEPGLYFVEGSVKLHKVSGDVTIVSRGPQKYTGELDLTRYLDDLVMFSNAPGSPSCGYDAIRFDAASGTWRGVIYAPNGQVSMSTSSAATQYGAIVAYTVDIGGAGFSLIYDPGSDVHRGPTVQIEH